MSSFDPAAYPAPLAELLNIDRCRVLGPGDPNEAALAGLEELSVDTAFEGQTIADREMAQLCISGLWLLHDFLEESHRISQQIDSSSGSYWHGIMHRREPDYSNSKYWFRRTSPRL